MEESRLAFYYRLLSPDDISLECYAFQPHPRCWWSWWHNVCQKKCGSGPHSVPGLHCSREHYVSESSANIESKDKITMTITMCTLRHQQLNFHTDLLHLNNNFFFHLICSHNLIYLDVALNSACPTSTFFASNHILVSSLTIWSSDPWGRCLSKATHRHRQLLPKLWSTKVTWSNTPGSMPHCPRISDVLCPRLRFVLVRHFPTLFIVKQGKRLICLYTRYTLYSILLALFIKMNR